MRSVVVPAPCPVTGEHTGCPLHASVLRDGSPAFAASALGGLLAQGSRGFFGSRGCSQAVRGRQPPAREGPDLPASLQAPAGRAQPQQKAPRAQVPLWAGSGHGAMQQSLSRALSPGGAQTPGLCGLRLL